MSIAEKLTYLQTTKQLLKTEINKINNVLDDNSTFRSYPQELFNGYLDILNNGTDTLWNNLEKVSASGEEATLENVENAPIKMVLNGNTSQETTTGKNLLKLGAGETHLGITSVINANGSISYSGTAESSYCKLGTEVNVNIPAGTYAFSRNERLNYGTRILITFEDNTTTNPTIASGNLAATFTTTQTIKKIQVYLITLTANTTYNGTQYLQLESGSTATSWEKYTGGQPSPNPDYPQEVKVVKGENVVSVSGKNLFDTDSTDTNISGCSKNVSDNKIILTSTTSTTGYCGFRIRNGKPNTSYTLRYNAVADYFAGYQIRSYDESDAGTTIIGTTNSTNANRTFTTPNDCSYISIFLYSSNNKEATIGQKTTYSNIQLEEGSTATEYEPYSKTDYPINLGDIELCKINTYKDYFHKDSGKWYVHKEIGKKVFDGTENWSASGTQTTGYYRFSNASLQGVILPPSSNDEALLAYFNTFETISANNTYRRHNGISCRTSGNYIDVYYDQLAEGTAEDFKTWLSTHNTIVYYVLATPTETEITNTTLIEQLEAISKAKSVKDKTYITQTNEELPFILDVEAIKEYEVV